MNPLHAALLGLVEGLTEFVPVSSTGHLIIVDRWLGKHGDAVDAFEIVIQLGALLACVIYYRKVLIGMLTGVARGDAKARRLLTSIMCAFVPTAGVGFLLHKKIEALLFGRLAAIAGAMITGGIVMIVVEVWRRKRGARIEDLAEISPAQGFFIGCVQCASLWPGTSRSMASIVGGLLAGLSTRVAADFAFLIGIPTLGAAALFKLVKSRHVLLTEVGASSMAIGLSVAFVVGWLVIAAFLRYLRKTGLTPFGIYRGVVGAIVLFSL